jgi:probable HAF family extracellular repeat protein
MSAMTTRRPRLESLEDRCLPSYTVVQLPTLGGQISQGQAINNAGQVAGIADNPDVNYDRAYLWDPNTGIQDLGSLNGHGSEGFALNNLGQVTGFSDVPNAFHAFLSGDTGLVDLGTPGGDFSVGYAVNDQGDVAGAATIVPGNGAPFRPALYTAGAMQDLGTLGGNSGEAHGMNSSDHVVGWSQTASNVVHAFFYSPDAGLVDLGTPDGATDSTAFAINESDQVTGSAGVNGNQRAFLYTSSGGFQDLGTLPGDAFSIAYGINNLGQTVGTSGLPMQGSSAVLFDGGQVSDLNSLIPPDSGITLQRANGINDQGQIVVEGFDNASHQPHSYVLTPSMAPNPGGHSSSRGSAVAGPVDAASAAVLNELGHAQPVSITSTLSSGSGLSSPPSATSSVDSPATPLAARPSSPAGRLFTALQHDSQTNSAHPLDESPAWEGFVR